MSSDRKFDEAHRELIKGCQRLKKYAEDFCREADGRLKVGIPIRNHDERPRDKSGFPIVYGALYTHRFTSGFLLLRPVRHEGVNEEKDRIYCEVVFPWFETQHMRSHVCYSNDLQRPDPAVMGRQFQTFLTALAMYRKELEHGLKDEDAQ